MSNAEVPSRFVFINREEEQLLVDEMVQGLYRLVHVQVQEVMRDGEVIRAIREKMAARLRSLPLRTGDVMHLDVQNYFQTRRRGLQGVVVRATNPLQPDGRDILLHGEVRSPQIICVAQGLFKGMAARLELVEFSVDPGTREETEILSGGMMLDTFSMDRPDAIACAKRGRRVVCQAPFKFGAVIEVLQKDTAQDPADGNESANLPFNPGITWSDYYQIEAEEES